jgi:predicted amidohydrolase
MKIGHFQCWVKCGDFDENLKTLLRGLDQAKAEELEIVCFPESLLTGYFSNDKEARKNSFRIDGPEIKRLLDEIKDYDITIVVGFNELRDDKIFNSALVARGNVLEGVYAKAFPVLSYFEPGRDFPVFQRGPLTFGVVICADGTYIEPTRILAFKGARLVIAPHYNYIAPEGVITHFVRTRADHIARARENGLWFLRGNNYVEGVDAGCDHEGIGQGESYILDSLGEIVCRAIRGQECLISADIDFEFAKQATPADPFQFCDRSVTSARALGHIVNEIVSLETGTERS